MARPKADGKTQQANRLRVLTWLELEPNMSNMEIHRRTGIPVSTVRGIKKKWGGKPLEMKHMRQKKMPGRPLKRSRRWMRCAFSGIFEAFSIFFLFRHLARISQKGEGQSLVELANLMYQWELAREQSRPPGAVFRMPVRAGKASIMRYLKKLGISHYRCLKVGIA